MLAVMVWCTRLPGLESSLLNTTAEDALYDEMMLTLMRLVLSPVLAKHGKITEPEKSPTLWTRTNGCPDDGHPVTGCDETWKNLFNWRIYVKKNFQYSDLRDRLPKYSDLQDRLPKYSDLQDRLPKYSDLQDRLPK